MQSTLTWTAAGALMFGLASYLLLSWFLNHSEFSQFKELVGLSAVVGAALGRIVGKRLSSENA